MARLQNAEHGSVDPDEFDAFKLSFCKDYRAVLGRKLGVKEIRMVCAKNAGRETTRDVPTPKNNKLVAASTTT